MISEIKSAEFIDGRKIPIDGELYYRGINIEDLTHGFFNDRRFGFEETTYLLLFGKLPNVSELKRFRQMLVDQRSLPTNFVRDVIMKAPTGDIMNSMQRSVLTLASYDKYADDTSLANVLRQCVNLIASFPMMAVYAYHAHNHYNRGHSLYIHNPSRKLSTAENILRLLRPDKKYTELEARVLDLALVLHMEHGGGNNSTFTMHVVTSSGTDTYSAVAASLASLKGPKHGGANIKVMEMMQDVKNFIVDPKLISFDMAPLFDLRTGEKSAQIWEKCFAIADAINARGFRTASHYSVSKTKIHFCMADTPRQSLVISPEGKLYSCEHVASVESLGDVWEGVTNTALVKKLESVEPAQEHCRGCFSLPQCTTFTGCPNYRTDCRFVARKRLDAALDKMLRYFEKNQKDGEDTEESDAVC